MADGNKPYENQRPDPFEGIKFPEKFLKDGKPDLTGFVTSYGELETNFRAKTEDLRNTVKAELETEYKKGRVEAADKYSLPKIEGVDEKELAENPLLKSFREDAFKAGFTDEQFGTAVKRYVETLAEEEIDMAAVNEALGENAKQRIAAVDTWAKSFAKSDGELAQLQKIATNADGIKVLERLGGLAEGGDDGEQGNREPEITLEALRKMQDDPRYYDPNKREEAWVKKVNDGYEKLYPSKR